MARHACTIDDEAQREARDMATFQALALANLKRAFRALDVWRLQDAMIWTAEALRLIRTLRSKERAADARRSQSPSHSVTQSLPSDPDG